MVVRTTRIDCCRVCSRFATWLDGASCTHCPRRTAQQRRHDRGWMAHLLAASMCPSWACMYGHTAPHFSECVWMPGCPVCMHVGRGSDYGSHIQVCACACMPQPIPTHCKQKTLHVLSHAMKLYMILLMIQVTFAPRDPFHQPILDFGSRCAQTRARCIPYPGLGS